MTTLPIPSGPTNKELIDRAYQVIGISDAMFGRTPEEYAEAVIILGAMAEEWPFDQLGFIVEDAAGLRVEEESGIARKHMNAVAHYLAEQLAPIHGKTLTPEARKVKNRTYSALCAEVNDPPPAEFADGTIRGSGARGDRYYRRSAFFPGR